MKEPDEKKQVSLLGGWEDENERAQFLLKCKPATANEEGACRQALLEFRDKAQATANRDDLWADIQIRAALLACAAPPDPNYGKNPFGDEESEPPSDTVRTLATTILLCLAGSTSVRRDMAVSSDVRNTLVGNAAHDRPTLLRHRTFMTLSNLAIDGLLTDPSDDHIPSRPPTPVACEVCGLIPCVCFAGEKEDHSSDLEVFHAWMNGLEVKESASLREHILGSLSTVSASCTVDAWKMWGNRKLRSSVVANAAMDQPMDVRSSALSALWAFSACDHIQARMWDEKSVRDVLMTCAEARVGQPGESVAQPAMLRNKALCTMENLATMNVNRNPMWRNGRAARVLLQAVSDGGMLRSNSLRVLVELTKCWDNLARMVHSGVLEMMAAAVDDASLDKKERRNCAFAYERLQEADDASRKGPWLP